MASDTDQTHILTVDEVDAVDDIDERIVQIPQWGGSVRLRTPTLRRVELLKRQATFKGQIDQDRFVALIMVECLVDPKIDLGVYERWMDKSAAAVATLQKEAVAICGLSEAAVADADKRDAHQPDVADPILLSARVENDAQVIPARGNRR